MGDDRVGANSFARTKRYVRMNSHLHERRNAMNENNGHYQLRFSNSFIQPQQRRDKILRDERAQIVQAFAHADEAHRDRQRRSLCSGLWPGLEWVVVDVRSYIHDLFLLRMLTARCRESNFECRLQGSCPLRRKITGRIIYAFRHIDCLGYSRNTARRTESCGHKTICRAG